MSTPVPAGDRDANERPSGQNRGIRRRSAQRLLHGPPVLGQRTRSVVPRFLSPPARGRRRSSPPVGHSANRSATGAGDCFKIGRDQLKSPHLVVSPSLNLSAP